MAIKIISSIIMVGESMQLEEHQELLIKQVFEGAELFGFETRNKYQILDKRGNSLGHIAEQQKGMMGFFLRQYLGHWRTFDLHIFDHTRTEVLYAHHPFRFFFQELEIKDKNKKLIGHIEQKFSILSKKFEVRDSYNRVLFEINSPFWKIWTFPFIKRGREVAKVQKKWSGFLAEGFTDKDSFLISFGYQGLSQTERELILAASIFIDLQYFERKSGR